MGVGKTVKLGILREDKQVSLDVKLSAADQASVTAENLHQMLAGANFANGKTPDGDPGVLISDVADGSPAARLGLSKGDVIIGIGRTQVNRLPDSCAYVYKNRFYLHMTGMCRCHKHISAGNDSNLLIVFYVQIMPDDFVMQLHRF